MPFEDRRVRDAGPMKWPRPDLKRRRPESSPLFAYLLDADDDLAERFDVRTRVAARQLATARVLEAPIGKCDLAPLFEAAGTGPGLLILDGLVAFETSVGDRTAMELLGAGDLLQRSTRRPDDLLDRMDAWRVLGPTRFALLDAEFVERVRPWPQIVEELLRRVARRVGDIGTVRAITSQPRLEVRLVLLLWHLAGRWGRVEPAGIRLTLPLTHRLLGQLVGAERPSISHAMARLAHAGLVVGGACDLHLHGTLEQHLEALIERTGAVRERPVGNGRSARQRIA